MGSVSTLVSHHARCPVVIVPAETADSTGPDHRGRTWPPGCLIALIALPFRNRSAGVPAAEDALGDGHRADDGEQPQEHR
jgi:hypothetical protein